MASSTLSGFSCFGNWTKLLEHVEHGVLFRAEVPLERLDTTSP